jgi:uncharacterized protein (DUF934 family)
MRLIPSPQAPAADALVLSNTDDVLALGETIHQVGVVVLNFPKWTDGRAYSQAVLLRGRLRFSGEIRATGDVLVDMLPLLRRCGFDAVQLRADQDPVVAQRTLGQFPGHYQGDAAGGSPAPFAQHAA